MSPTDVDVNTDGLSVPEIEAKVEICQMFFRRRRKMDISLRLDVLDSWRLLAVRSCFRSFTMWLWKTSKGQAHFLRKSGNAVVNAWQQSPRSGTPKLRKRNGLGTLDYRFRYDMS